MQDSVFCISGVVQHARVFEECLEIGSGQFYLAETSLASKLSSNRNFSPPKVSPLLPLSIEEISQS